MLYGMNHTVGLCDIALFGMDIGHGTPFMESNSPGWMSTPVTTSQIKTIPPPVKKAGRVEVAPRKTRT